MADVACIGAHPDDIEIGMGATIVERHFTLDQSLKGPDHAMSLDPVEIGELSHRIRKTIEMIGSEYLTMYEAEKPFARKVGRIREE